MLAARIDVVGSNKKKTTTDVVKRDKTGGLDKHDGFAPHTSYQKRLSEVLSLVVMGVSKDLLSQCHVWNVCVHVCKTINWLFIYM